jgi:regulator of sigma E protease
MGLDSVLKNNVLPVQPKEVTVRLPSGEEKKVFRIGLMGIQDQFNQPVGLVDGVGKSFAATAYAVRMVVGIVVKLLSRQESMKNVGGPILIGQVAGQAARRGLDDFLAIMALISVNLGVLNLLPIPVLDGGHLVFFLIEAVRRKPVSLKVRERFQQVGMALLLMLMVVVFYNDIARLIMGAPG